MNANAIINIAKSQLGLEEDDYRAVLERTTGKASLRLMTNPDKLKVIDEMKRLGFKAKTATKPYIRLIHALWKSCHRLGVVEDGSRTALRAFCANRLPSNVSTDPDLLNYEQASPIIEALKSMEKRGKAK